MTSSLSFSAAGCVVAKKQRWETTKRSATAEKLLELYFFCRDFSPLFVFFFGTSGRVRKRFLVGKSLDWDSDSQSNMNGCPLVPLGDEGNMDFFFPP